VIRPAAPPPPAQPAPILQAHAGADADPTTADEEVN
jgi:hypothetical protein